MIKTDEVIKGLEQFKADIKPFCGGHADWERFDAGLALLKEKKESIPLKQLCEWLAGYAAPPGQESWLALYGSIEKAWEAVLTELFLKKQGSDQHEE